MYILCVRINICYFFFLQTMSFDWVNNLVVSGITSINSQLSHLVINNCNDVVVKNVKLIAPDKSPNTDGIHVQYSNRVTINGCIMQTGDDCISIGDATYNLLMSNIKCGPGHGVRLVSPWFMSIWVQNKQTLNSITN